MNYGGVTTNLGELDIDIAEDMEREFSPNRKEQTMADTFSTAKQAQNYNPSSTPMNSLHSAVSQLREACSDVGSLADQLCGSAPSEIKGGVEGDSGSHFGQIEDCARAVSDLAASIDADLKRIRARL